MKLKENRRTRPRECTCIPGLFKRIECLFLENMVALRK